LLRIQASLQAPQGFILVPPRGGLPHVGGEGEEVDIGDLQPVFPGPGGQR